MSELNLKIIYSQEEIEFINICKHAKFEFLCKIIRDIFKNSSNKIDKSKLVIIYGIPPKIVYEEYVDTDMTLEHFKFENDSIVRVSIDEENSFDPSYFSNSDIEEQKKELDKYSNIRIQDSNLKIIKSNDNNNKEQKSKNKFETGQSQDKAIFFDINSSEIYRNFNN